MRWGLAALVLVALIVVATEAQNNQRTQSRTRVSANATPSKTRTLRTNRQVKARTGNTKKRSLSGTSSRRSAIIIGNGSSSSSSSTPAARCITTTCNANTNVCGRWALTRRCHRFRNNCQLERSNCRSTGSSWNRVNIGNCSSISVNSTGTCTSTFSSTSSSSSTSSTISSILSSILGTSSTSSTSNVIPIIIRRG